MPKTVTLEFNPNFNGGYLEALGKNLEKEINESSFKDNLIKSIRLIMNMPSIMNIPLVESYNMKLIIGKDETINIVFLKNIFMVGQKTVNSKKELYFEIIRLHNLVNPISKSKTTNLELSKSNAAQHSTTSTATTNFELPKPISTKPSTTFIATTNLELPKPISTKPIFTKPETTELQYFLPTKSEISKSKTTNLELPKPISTKPSNTTISKSIPTKPSTTTSIDAKTSIATTTISKSIPTKPSTTYIPTTTISTKPIFTKQETTEIQYFSPTKTTNLELPKPISTKPISTTKLQYYPTTSQSRTLERIIEDTLDKYTLDELIIAANKKKKEIQERKSISLA
jgi:hypothetical protein